MKKFIVFALCAISACSVFAEPYSKAKAKELNKTKDYKKWAAYCYSAELSSETNDYQLSGVCHHIIYNKFSKQQGLKQLEKFKGKVNEKFYNEQVGIFLADLGFVQDAEKISDRLSVKYKIYQYHFNTKNKDMMWKSAKNLLLVDGGYENITLATYVLNNMFRYKPESITKEQQIEFLSKLSQIYPIPGTDFNQWKGFMGFVGFKYKQLTGKDLF